MTLSFSLIIIVIMTIIMLVMKHGSFEMEKRNKIIATAMEVPQALRRGLHIVVYKKMRETPG